MKILYFIIFLFLLIFIGIQCSYYYEIALPRWIRFYVNDFICMPIVLTICLKAVHLLKKDTVIRLSLFPILSLTLIYSIYFEMYLPTVEPRYTADILDVLMYFSGSLLFYFLQFQNNKKDAQVASLKKY